MPKNVQNPAHGRLSLQRLRTGLDELFGRWDGQEPGLAVAVVRAGEPLYAKGFGLADLAHRVPIDTSTVFNLGSVSKHFTAFGLLLLAHRGKLGLDQRIREFLPELHPCTDAIRLYDAVYHTSGLNDYINSMLIGGSALDDLWYRRQVSAVIARQDRLAFEPGHEHYYSNSGYVLLAEIIARASGQSFADFMRDEIFRPFGMRSTGFTEFCNEVIPRHATSYWVDEDEPVIAASHGWDVNGDAGLHSCVDDLVAWLRATQTVKGEFGEVWRAQRRPGRLRDGTALKYAGGLEVDGFLEPGVVRHGGVFAGFKAHIAYFLEHKLGIAIASNRSDASPWPLVNRVAALYLGQTIPAQWNKHPLRANKLEPFCGDYLTSSGTLLSVYQSDGVLVLDRTLHGPKRLMPKSEGQFENVGDEEVLTFERGLDTVVSHFDLRCRNGSATRLCSTYRYAVKLLPHSLPAADLMHYQGLYLNRQFECVHSLIVVDGQLVLRWLRFDDSVLTPFVRVDDDEGRTVFVASAWGGVFEFFGGGGTRVGGYTVSGERVRGLQFSRVGSASL